MIRCNGKQKVKKRKREHERKKRDKKTASSPALNEHVLI